MIYRLLSAFLIIVGASACQSTHPGIGCTYVHPYGITVDSDRWFENGCNGQKVVTAEDGVTATQTYMNGMLHGSSIYTFPASDKIERSEDYVNDKLVKQLFYDFSGTPTHSVKYSDPNFRVITVWYKAGTPKSIEVYRGKKLISGEYYTLTNQQDSCVREGEGERVNHNELGCILSRDQIQDGTLISTTLLYPDGSPEQITYYDTNGAIDGMRKSFYPGGEPLQFEMWQCGEKTGITTIFQDGSKFADVPYVKGKKNGIERRYDDHENLTHEISWKEGKMHGPSCAYDADQVASTDWYYLGRLTSRENYESSTHFKGK